MTRIVSPGPDASTEPPDRTPVQLVELEPPGSPPEAGLPTAVPRPIRPGRPAPQPLGDQAEVSGVYRGGGDVPIQRGEERPQGSVDEPSGGLDTEGGRVDWWAELDRQVHGERDDEAWLLEQGLRPYRSVMQGRSPGRVDQGRRRDAGQTVYGEAWTNAYGEVEVAISENCRLVLPPVTSTLDFDRHRPAWVNCRQRSEFQFELPRTMGAPLREARQLPR